jgi:hypothetical protein
MTMKKREEHPGLPATNSGPRPADFPLGSVESRAAVRAMINRRAAPDEKAPTIYRASWVGRPQDEDFEILDLATGLPVPATRGPTGPDQQSLSGRMKFCRMPRREQPLHNLERSRLLHKKQRRSMRFWTCKPRACWTRPRWLAD